MIRRLLVTYLTITALALTALAVPLGLTFSRRERDRLYADIERDAVVVAALVEDALEEGDTLDVDAVLGTYRDNTQGRVLVVDRDGVSVADSDRPGGPGRDYSTRREIERALQGERVSGSRHSDTLDGDLVFVAIPVTSGGRIHGAVRLTFPRAALDDRVQDTWVRLGLLAGVVLAIVAGVGFVLARGVTRPVRRLEEAAERMADGDLAARAEVHGGAPELQALAATFNRTADQLATLVGAQQRFVADAAHQLRTPLTGLRLRLENLEPHLPPSEVGKLYAAAGEVARLSRLVDGLLTLARSDTPAGSVGPVDLAALAADRVDAWAGVAAEDGVEVRADLPVALWASVPAGVTEQILDNLIENALTHSPPGGAVTVGGRAGPGGSVTLDVTDEGAGLSAEQRQRSFDRFWRADPSGPGTGLGLSIVRQLARAAGGDAELAAAPGPSGLRASVRFPGAGPSNP